MHSESKLDRVVGGEDYTPSQIINSTLLTHQEKIALLKELKLKAAKGGHGAPPFTAEELDNAMEELKRRAQNRNGIHVDVAIGRTG